MSTKKRGRRPSALTRERNDWLYRQWLILGQRRGFPTLLKLLNDEIDAMIRDGKVPWARLRNKRAVHATLYRYAREERLPFDPRDRRTGGIW